jgi:hypothetical protein
MRFEEAYAGWQEGRLRQEEAVRLLGVCERSFRRYIDRYEEEGLQGLIDHRVGQISQRRAPVDEVMALTRAYRARHEGWSAKHYYQWYRRAGGKRSYTWVKCELQKAHWSRRRRSVERTANGVIGRLCPGCCCTKMAAGTSGWRISAGI